MVLGVIYRGSYLSANVLLNVLNEMRKSDKMRGLPSILSLFRNEFDKYNKTGPRVLDFIYHITLKYFCNAFCGVKTSRFYHIYLIMLWASFQ